MSVDFLDSLSIMPTASRMSVKLKKGEVYRAFYGTPDPPKGYRWETDAELRERIKKIINP